MKQFLFSAIIACGLFLLIGCADASFSAEDNGIQSVDIPKELGLSDVQTYGLYDYYGDDLLFSICNTEKHAPGEDETAQANAPYVEKFILYDITDEKVEAEYAVGQFGFIQSALLFNDGILFSFYTSDHPAVLYVGSEGIKMVCDVEFTPYDLGPLLFRCEDAALFSYSNYTDDLFGLKSISSTLAVEPLLTFQSGNTEYITDDYRTSASKYVYAVGKEDKVTFYIGSTTTDPIEISLASEEKINSFDLVDDTLVVCKETYTSTEGTYFLEKFDLAGNSLEIYKIDEPLVRIRANNDGQVCGFHALTPFELYETNPKIQPVANAETSIITTFNSCLSNGENFVIYSLDPACKMLWVLKPE